MPLPDFFHEQHLLDRGLGPVAGVDEAGRGPLAGPVAAAAVILDPNNIPVGLDDSKRLSASARAALHDEILACALSVSIALSPAAMIDASNIRTASLDAMRRAVAGLSIRPGFALVDGRDVPPGLCCPARALVRGDAISASIAAASIVAKVTRDRLMQRLHIHAPAYGFGIHKGYGTAIHLAALAQHDRSQWHRTSFQLRRHSAAEG